MAATPTYYEYIVVGVGGIGSGALYWLSKRANKGVLGLEQFEIGHVNGGSQDYSRIIRQYDDVDFMKLIPPAYAAWDAVESESGLQVVHKTGSLDIANKAEAGWIIEHHAKALEQSNLPFQRLTGPELHRMYPQFTVGEETVALYQKDGGVVDAAIGNGAHIQLARAHGATIIDRCPVVRLARDDKGNTLVYTTRGVFSCRRVIVSAGAWTNNVLGTIGVHIPLHVTQEQVTWFATPHIKKFTKDRFPIYLYHKPTYDYYGFPIHGNTGTKIGIDAVGPVVTAETRDFTPDPVREQQSIDFLKQTIPEFLGPKIVTKTCLYTMPLDRYFLIDDLGSRGWPDVIAFIGAGHAFKFASLFGRILSELAVDGRTDHNIAPFRYQREAILNPNFKPDYQMYEAAAEKSKL